jgi:hypothetical protein
MGYIHVYGACLVCKVPFFYNPLHVPSLEVEGVREPICASCITQVNDDRRQRGLPPFVIHPDAYVAEDEANVRFDE